ncbi:Glutamate--tRNA ligase mitochondrial [Madurella fahalii]|uniref:glutamate--tRNA ligase n=1 Tax=Madurella fahalii TaxID=1157608 RepID=A0ABQ0GRJ8_9PEZI
MRGIVLLRRPLCSGCAQRGLLSISQQRLQRFSFGSNLAAQAAVQQARREKFDLPDTPCRARFAPSPTGYLHLGSLRTALFNYLLAKATGGQFVLRIEDTDQSRLVPDAERRLYEDLRWAGLSWDEGPDIQGPYGPYRQSERLPLYSEHADKLVREGKAYRCFCSPEALEQHKRVAHEHGGSTQYPGTCRVISAEESDDRAAKGDKFAIRFKSAEEPVMIHDIVYHRYRKKDPEDDYIIMKRDGFPTYHFANVVDDRHMKITHVIRGAEWLISTPKHVELYNAFGWAPPKFAHLGLLVDEQKQKLSKRHAGANMSWYKDGYILPEALLNFAVLLGWRGKQKLGILGLQDMVNNFSMQFTRGDIVVSMAKLPHLQDQHLKRLWQNPTPTNTALFESHVLKPFRAAIREVDSARASGAETAPGDIPVASLGKPLPTAQILEERFRSDLGDGLLSAKGSSLMPDPTARFSAAVSHLRHFIWEIPRGALKASLLEIQPDTLTLRDKPAQLSDVMSHFVEQFSAVAEGSWTRDTLHRLLRDMEKQGPQGMYTLLRRALLAAGHGMPIARAMEILGREETLRRLEAARLAAEEISASQADGTSAA